MYVKIFQLTQNSVCHLNTAVMDPIQQKIVNIQKKIIDNPEAYSCEVRKYAGILDNCIKCNYDMRKNINLNLQVQPINTANVSKNILDDESNTIKISKIKRVILDSDLINQKSNDKLNSASNIKTIPEKIIERFILNRLGIMKLNRVDQKSLPSISCSFDDDMFDSYMIFLNSIDLRRGMRTLVSYDPNNFYKVLLSSYIDQTITGFISKLLGEFVEYTKTEKEGLLHILILIYVYSKAHNLNTDACKKKIISIEYLFKPCTEFTIRFQNDEFIDKFIMNMRRNTADLNEAAFLNSMYLVKNKSRQMIECFHIRLIGSLNILPDDFTMAFLIYVFTYSTVLYECLTEIQVFKLIISYYKSNLKPDKLLDLLDLLIDRVDNEEVSDFLIAEFKGIESNKLSHKKRLFINEIIQFKFINEYKDFFIRNKESFNALSLGLEYLQRISLYIDKNEIELLNILFCLFGVFKKEFFRSLVKPFNKMVINTLKNITIFDDKFLRFNNQQWNMLSTIILNTTKIGTEGQVSDKKKKTNSLKISEITKLALEMVETAAHVEKMAISAGLLNIVHIKKRGFMIKKQ